MNVLLYLLSYVGVTAFLATTAWSGARSLRLPALSRVALGLAATPLALALAALAITLLWPDAPRTVLLGGPAFALAGWAAFRVRRLAAVSNALLRRLRRIADRPRSLAWLVLVAGFLLLAGHTLWRNALEPIAAHDALVYFNEARHFAERPRWSTFIEMTNPVAADAVVRGHTHTWLFSSYIAPALLAGEGRPGPGDDFAARLAVQASLLHLLIAVGGLTWTISGRSPVLSLGAMAAAACIPHVSYITGATSIDAFRILPLLLVATVLCPSRRGPAGWLTAAGLLGVAGAAHTLNILFAPLVVLARLLAGLPRDQWRLFLRVYIPGQLIAALPVAGYYGHLWLETGRFFGNGMHYYFYVGPLAATPLASVLSQPVPSMAVVFGTLLQIQGRWPLLAPCIALLVIMALPRKSRGVFFIGLIFVLSMLMLLSGCWLDVTRKLTHMMLQNFRYPLGILVFGPPLVAGVVASLGICGGRASSRSVLRNWVGGLVAGIGLIAGGHQVLTQWPRSVDVREYLREGEWAVVRVASQHVTEKDDMWLTDRSTLAYYASRPPLSLYTPAGSRWILLKTEEEAAQALRDARVRVVAFSDQNPEWWPRTALHMALSRPGLAERIELPRWELFVLHRKEK